MRGAWLVFQKEWLCLVGAGGSALAVYAVIAVLWGALLAGAGVGGQPVMAILWALPFSVIAVSNFAQPVFVSERLTGAIEILCTSGLSRSSVVIGKGLFVSVAACAMGAVSWAVGFASVHALRARGVDAVLFEPGVAEVAVYGAAVVFNTFLGAVMSVLLPNPRLSHFVDFVVIAGVVAVYYARGSGSVSDAWTLAAMLAVAAAVLASLACRLAYTERAARTSEL